MKIKMNCLPRASLEAFAEVYELTMVIEERVPKDMGDRWSESSRYYAKFEDCEVKHGCGLRSEYGNGRTPGEAMANYAQGISGALLVLNAFGPNRREIQVPILTLEKE